MNRWMLFIIICFAIAEFAPLPSHDGEYSVTQVQAMNDLVENLTADDRLSQMERAHAKQ